MNAYKILLEALMNVKICIVEFTCLKYETLCNQLPIETRLESLEIRADTRYDMLNDY